MILALFFLDQAFGSFGLCGTTCVSVAVEAGEQLSADCTWSSSMSEDGRQDQCFGFSVLWIRKD